MNFSKMIVHRFILSTLLLIGFSACNEESGVNSTLNFDQQAMLTNIGQNIIFPAYNLYKEKTSALREAVNTFSNEPNEANLTSAQEALKEAYIAWQGVTFYEFGPAEDEAFRMKNNAFPTDTTKIKNSISTNSWDLTSFTSVDQKGLPALDYLLFKENALADFTTAENAATRLQYLKAVTNTLHALALHVYNQWNPQEVNYLETFTSNTGNSATSSLSLLVNQLNQGFEITKNQRLNIPRGGRSVNGDPFPKKVEAYYSGISLDLIEANINALESLYKGQANGTDGLGLDDNIKAHYEAGNIENDLNATILGLIASLRTQINEIPGPLSQAVVNDNAKVSAAYNEAQELVGYLKTEMPQTLSVVISYIDNDGD